MKSRFDLVRQFTDDFNEILRPWTTTSYTVNGQFFDLEKYDVVLKPNYIDREIRRVEQDIETLERQQQSTTKYYENRKIALLEEKEKYKRQKTKSG
jgi:hypothetical protein